MLSGLGLFGFRAKAVLLLGVRRYWGWRHGFVAKARLDRVRWPSFTGGHMLKGAVGPII